MLGHISSGWRTIPPARISTTTVARERSKNELYQAARLAMQAVKLRSAARHVLEQLVGCFSGEPVAEKILVWPSNEFLMERTGLSERAVRYALRDLLISGLIQAKDSANGKRFPIRSKSGEVMDAYGFDLTPLSSRLEEFSAVVEELEEERRRRKSAFDRITICRRSIQALVVALDPTLTRGLVAEAERLVSLTPRRDSKMPADLALSMWTSLLDEAQTIYEAAFGGKECRNIEDNNEALQESCQNGQEDMRGANTEISLGQLADACPDAIGYLPGPATWESIMETAGKLRGAFGVHASAWQEARELLGGRAGAVFMVALQFYELDQRGKATIKNFGGFFRSYVRRVAQNEVDLAQEIRLMKRRRQH
ncbi:MULTISPECIES: replication initiation protein RepC [unclassified Ensifer]|uniref:replication initiation protein RepC n=1 Tax=unclassified Ensifer TaxID=2633371 RepID=UPI00081374D2|nr:MULTISPECIES: replication initiation protein RepC [unclassified Ensifer]OCP22023.1 hypothetical protein BC361_26005 [Ensifer sp. LC54]OCP23197.1 hypothetical protein BC363_24760 [Ensifer sp. LC384]